MHSRLLLCSLAALLIAALPRPAAATLGADASSVEADRAQLRGALRVTGAARYAVHEITLPSGALVREYAAPNGTVFALTWSGPWPPDLRQLLGSYFERFRRAAEVRGVAHRPLFVQDDTLVVQFAGRPRAFVGAAYLTDQIPTGVRAEQLP